MSSTTPVNDTAYAPTPRIEAFAEEVERLKITGGKANPERMLSKLGGLGMIAGIIVSLLAWQGTRSSTTDLDVADFGALGTLGLALVIVGTGLFAVMSLRRYLRYWLVRLIFELRDQADRSVDPES